MAPIMPLRTSWALLVLLCLPLAGCAAVALHAEPVPAAPGAPLELVLTNETRSTLGYNLCTSTLERRVDVEWQPLPADRVCTMELRSLGYREAARFRLELPRDLLPGEYRFATAVHWLERGERHVLRTPQFTVGRP